MSSKCPARWQREGEGVVSPSCRTVWKSPRNSLDQDKEEYMMKHGQVMLEMLGQSRWQGFELQRLILRRDDGSEVPVLLFLPQGKETPSAGRVRQRRH
jgi:hypothetical protein